MVQKTSRVNYFHVCGFKMNFHQSFHGFWSTLGLTIILLFTNAKEGFYLSETISVMVSFVIVVVLLCFVLFYARGVLAVFSDWI